MDLETGESNIIDNMEGGAFSPDGRKFMGIGMNLRAKCYSFDGEILEQFSLRQYFSKGTMLNSFDWSPDGDQLVINTLNQVYHTILMRNVLK